MATDTQERPNIEEQYSSATNTSDMRVDTREGSARRPADNIIAAGWSRSRIGAALLRLHSEWDSSEKPQPPTPVQIHALAESLRRTQRTDGAGGHSFHAAAKTQAREWFFHEQKILVAKLKTLPAVRLELRAWCLRKGISGGEHKAPAVLMWWLEKTCPACHGLRYETIPGAPSLSSRVCQECMGTGEAHLPHGQDGRMIERYILDCLQSARSSMRGRFRHQKDGRSGAPLHNSGGSSIIPPGTARIAESVAPEDNGTSP